MDILNKKLLKIKNQTYDIAVMSKKECERGE